MADHRCVVCGLPSSRCKCERGPRTMALPQGKTCDDCRFFKHCSAFIGNVAGNTSCDWYPVRFIEAAKEAR